MGGEIELIITENKGRMGLKLVIMEIAELLVVFSFPETYSY